MAEFELTEDDAKQLVKQNSRMISEFKANKLESDARKNWDIFYKRNETKSQTAWTLLLKHLGFNTTYKSTVTILEERGKTSKQLKV